MKNKKISAKAHYSLLYARLMLFSTVFVVALSYLIVGIGAFAYSITPVSYEFFTAWNIVALLCSSVSLTVVVDTATYISYVRKFFRENDQTPYVPEIDYTGFVEAIKSNNADFFREIAIRVDEARAENHYSSASVQSIADEISSIKNQLETIDSKSGCGLNQTLFETLFTDAAKNRQNFSELSKRFDAQESYIKTIFNKIDNFKCSGGCSYTGGAQEKITGPIDAAEHAEIADAELSENTDTNPAAENTTPERARKKSFERKDSAAAESGQKGKGRTKKIIVRNVLPEANQNTEA